MDLEDMIRGAISSSSSKPRQELSSKKHAADMLKKFFAQEYDFEVGDFVERNEFGEIRYTLPKGNQVAQVVHIRERDYDTPSLKDDEVGNDVVVAVALAEGVVRLFELDGRFYQKASDATNVTFLNRFKKKGE